jgi:DNA gyrase/topoisomerase IV subunit A
MSERTGLDNVVLSTLEGLDELGALPDRTYVKSAKVVDRAYETRGIPPRHGYDAICTISIPWLVHLRLIDFHGNFGGRDRDDEPANARYTEVRLSPAGVMALAAERGDLPRLPIGLINGDLALGGTSPPFDPVRLADALRASGGSASDDDLVAMVGLPAFPTQCSVEGDLTTLASGAPARLRLSARTTFETSGPAAALVLSHFPFGVGPEDAASAIAHRVGAARDRGVRTVHPELQEQMDPGLRDVRNESAGDSTRVVCELLPGADPERCRARVLETWPVTTEFDARLRAPLPTLLRHVADGSVAQQEAVTALLAQ